VYLRLSPSPSSRNPFNLRPVISHLTNSNGCGNLQVKVLLTVSPSRPSFPPQFDVYSEPRSLCSPLVTRHSPLPLYFHQLAVSLSLPKKSTPLQSSKSSLFFENAGVGGGIPIPSLDSRRESTKTPGAGDATTGTGHPGWVPLRFLCSDLGAYVALLPASQTRHSSLVYPERCMRRATSPLFLKLATRHSPLATSPLFSAAGVHCD
jgi:hypothetical protein